LIRKQKDFGFPVNPICLLGLLYLINNCVDLHGLKDSMQVLSN